MKKNQSSRFFQRPATRTGWWAGGLAILAILMLGINSLGLNPFENLTSDGSTMLVTVYDLTMLASFLGAIVLGVSAITIKRERSWMVWLFMVPVIIFAGALMWMGLERAKYSSHLEVAPTQDPNIDRMPVIFDDDGSPDGTSALLYLLSDPRAQVTAVSVSYGEAHPQVYIHYLGRMLENFGYKEVPLGAGQDAPLAGENSFPESVREASNGFWGFGQVNQVPEYPVEDSAELIVRTVMQAEEPVTLLVSGALTNLASALRLEAGIKDNIAAVYIMGGAVNVWGNLDDLLPEPKNSVAEWNIYADPLAASEVFSSGLNLFLVPLDATNQVSLTKKDTGMWRNGGGVPNFAAEIYDSLMQSWSQDWIEMWDLMTAEIMMNPEHCTFTPLRLEVVTEEGVLQGQTRILQGDPNVEVCLKPDGDAIKSGLARVFSARK